MGETLQTLDASQDSIYNCLKYSQSPLSQRKNNLLTLIIKMKILFACTTITSTACAQFCVSIELQKHIHIFQYCFLKHITFCPCPELKPRLLSLEICTLTMRPLCLYYVVIFPLLRYKFTYHLVANQAYLHQVYPIKRQTEHVITSFH